MPLVLGGPWPSASKSCSYPLGTSARSTWKVRALYHGLTWSYPFGSARDTSRTFKPCVSQVPRHTTLLRARAHRTPPLTLERCNTTARTLAVRRPDAGAGKSDYKEHTCLSKSGTSSLFRAHPPSGTVSKLLRFVFDLTNQSRSLGLVVITTGLLIFLFHGQNFSSPFGSRGSRRRS